MQTITHFNRSKWAISSMTAAQIPMIVAWMKALSPERQMDTTQIIAQMQGELFLASKTNFPEYFIGHLENQPVFFLNGHLTKKKGHYPGNKGIREDYSLILLQNTTLLHYRELYLPVWHQVLKFLFDRHNIGRLLVELDEMDFVQKRAMLRFGFAPMDQSEAPPSKHQWQVCRRTDFLNYSV